MQKQNQIQNQNAAVSSLFQISYLILTVLSFLPMDDIVKMGLVSKTQQHVISQIRPRQIPFSSLCTFWTDRIRHYLRDMRWYHENLHRFEYITFFIPSELEILQISDNEFRFPVCSQKLNVRLRQLKFSFDRNQRILAEGLYFENYKLPIFHDQLSRASPFVSRRNMFGIISQLSTLITSYVLRHDET